MPRRRQELTATTNLLKAPYVQGPGGFRPGVCSGYIEWRSDVGGWPFHLAFGETSRLRGVGFSQLNEVRHGT